LFVTFVIAAGKLYLRVIDGAFSYSARAAIPGTRAAQANVAAAPRSVEARSPQA
jgi:hypothetical protein